MGLAKVANSVQGSIINNTMGNNKVMQTLCNVGILVSEVGYALASKIDRSVPSPASRIDRIIMESRNQSEKNKVPNEKKTAVVTGANSGIGFETARALGRAGFHTILACRNVEQAKEAVERLERQTGLEDRFEVMALDLASLESVAAFVEQFKARDCALDVLIDNAGLMMSPYGKTKDGIEMQFGTNHVGHFALTTGLLDALKRAEDGARIVVVSSMAAFMTPEINYEAVEVESKYNKTDNYAISKLANMTFTRALARKLEGSNVTVNVIHPGSIATNLTRHVGTSSIQHAAENAMLLDVSAGALTTIYVAMSPEVEGESGVFYARCLQMNMHPKALDVAEQDKLWEYTEKIAAEKSKAK
ncbi:Retinol dehydrogenase 14 [Coemansia sp. 'formosensis']|nr:Retinol dehydrogenase 14 [Coemansia sp. 'formosensis']